jgi:hypothetical protein
MVKYYFHFSLDNLLTRRLPSHAFIYPEIVLKLNVSVFVRAFAVGHKRK